MKHADVCSCAWKVKRTFLSTSCVSAPVVSVLHRQMCFLLKIKKKKKKKWRPEGGGGGWGVGRDSNGQVLLEEINITLTGTPLN